MYKLAHFTEPDQQKVIDFMKDNAFAVITGFGEQYPVATHIPLEVDLNPGGKIVLSGHLMRKTDHHRAFEKNDHVLVIFNGPHAYVSASWYSNPQSASTLNYMTVHAKGKITFTDEEGTYQAIKAITNKYEGTASAAAFDNLPADYIQQMLKAIVGFKIEVEHTDNVFKLSQNHNQQNRQSIAAHLHQKNNDQSEAIAKEMDSRY